MKIFLARIAAFFSLLLLLFVMGIVFFSNSNKFLKKRYDLGTRDFAVFMGDSHVRSSLNDKQIENHVNLGLYAETFYFTYYKLKFLLAENSNVKRVYLGLGYHSLSNFYDKFIYGKDSKTISSNYFSYSPLNNNYYICIATPWTSHLI